VARRLAAAGICVAGKHGPHAFRHAHAVSLLRAQVPLKVIGDLLGHRATDSTAVYLKLATADLRAVALEVPA
jgi:site-specific recombinase XerD